MYQHTYRVKKACNGYSRTVTGVSFIRKKGRGNILNLIFSSNSSCFLSFCSCSLS